jgi:hypothetical protein
VHDLHHLRNLFRGQVCELAVVDGNVGFAARRIFGQRRAGHFMQDALGHLLHAGEVGRPGGGIMKLKDK